MDFSYEAYTVKEGIVKGRIEATNESEARDAVMRLGYKPLRVSQVWRPPALEEMFPSLFRVSLAELVRFARQLSTMLASGGSLVRTMEMLQEESSNRMMRRTIEAIRRSLDEGSSLSDALKQHPNIFSPLFVSVLEVGEYTGRLGPSLEQMADILEREHAAKQKAMQTMMYPVAIIGLSMVTLFVLMTVALPPLLDTFDKLGAELPVMTKIAVGGVRAVKDNLAKIPIAFTAVLVFFVAAGRIPKIKYLMDIARARAPVVGSFTVAGEVARMARTTTMLLQAEVPLATALQLARGGSKNLVIQEALADAEESLMSGHGVSEALSRHSILPSMFVQLVSIGEASNSLVRTMSDAAEAYQKQFEQRLNSLLGLLEPASTLVVGGIVGFIALSMFVPIYSGISAIE